jgi:8-oxo-dGTP diphosphatase
MIMGLGGKAWPGESEAGCAVQEAGIAVDPDSLAWRAEISFVYPARPGLDAVVTVFIGWDWSGEPQESEEMAPQWFDAASLPLDQMLDDEAYWLPRVMAGEAIAGVITYDGAGTRVARAELRAAGPRPGAWTPETGANPGGS